MKRRKGPLHEAADKLERRLRYKGVPARYLRSRYEDIGKVFGFTMSRPWAKDGAMKSYRTKTQDSTIKGIFQDTALSKSSQVVAVGAYPTDHLGMVFGAAVCRRALDLKLNPLMLNLRSSPHNTEIDEPPDVVVLHNVSPSSHPNRIEGCRDWITLFDDTFVVVIVGGSDPATFFHMNLRYSFNAALYFQGE